MLKCKHEHVTFVPTEQTGSFWIAELCDTWLSDCSVSGSLSTWQVRTVAQFSFQNMLLNLVSHIFNSEIKRRTGHLLLHSFCRCVKLLEFACRVLFGLNRLTINSQNPEN